VQEDIPPAGRGGGRGGNTREFLGLGPPPDAAAAARGERLLAFDPAAGRILWHFRLGAMMSNGPSTYMLNGSQYLLVGAGDTLFAFKLAGERKR
jgi:hypothetical protein